MKPEFERPDLLQRLPWRDWIRDEMPAGPEGWVAEDLDLIVRRYTSSDPVGRFMLVELKYGEAGLGKAQFMTFGLMDGLLRTADPQGKRYLGYYLLNYPESEWEGCSGFRVNGIPLAIQGLKKWLAMEVILPAYRFPPLSFNEEETR